MDDRMLFPRRRPPHSLYGSPRPNVALLKTHSGGNHEITQTLPLEAPRRDQHTSAQSSYSDLSVQKGYLEILLHLFLAVLLVCVNHIVFTHLNGAEPGNHTNQFWVTVIKNVFPAAVASLFFMGLKKCLEQMALYCVRLNSYPLELVNPVISPPGFLNTLSILFNSSRRASIMCFAILATITQAVALTSLFIPGTLIVVPTPSRTQTLDVFTLNFDVFDPVQSAFFQYMNMDLNSTTVPVLGFIESSQRWYQLILRAASSDIAPTWKPPTECGSACRYTFFYIAPALNCTSLSKEDIWPSGTRSNDSRLLFPLIDSTDTRFYFYNSTVGVLNSDTGNPNETSFVIDAIYLDLDSKRLDEEVFREPVIDPTQWSPRGVHCTYQNATYEATTEYVNNTQISSTRVMEWNGLLQSGYSFFGPYANTSTTNATMAFRSIVESFGKILQGDASSINNFGANTSNTQAVSTPLVSLTGVPNIQTGFEGSPYFHFSLSPALDGDLAAGLQSLLGNVTLAFVTEQAVTTRTEVVVTPNNTQYHYVSWRLGLIYGIVFGFALVVIGHGLFCLWKNRTVAVFDLQNILEMTAGSTRLRESVGSPAFGSTLVRGVSFSEKDGTFRRVVFDVSEPS